LKDKRYTAIKSLIQSNSLQGFKDIFTVVPVSVVKNDLEMNYTTLRNRIDNVELLTVQNITAMAELFEVEPGEVFKLVVADLNSGKGKKRK
jgi:hypothetical protein